MEGKSFSIISGCLTAKWPFFNWIMIFYVFFLNFVWIVNYQSGATFLDLLTPLTPPGCVFIVDWNKTKATSSTVIWFLSVLRIFRSFRSPFFNCSKNPGIFGKWSRVPIMEFRFASGPRHSMIFRLHIVRQKYLKIIVSKANFFLNTYFIFHFLHQLKWFCETIFLTIEMWDMYLFQSLSYRISAK